jgi:hypothetical protein
MFDFVLLREAMKYYIVRKDLCHIPQGGFPRSSWLLTLFKYAFNPNDNIIQSHLNVYGYFIIMTRDTPRLLIYITN